MRPKALDLFCGEGGVGMGLHRAGFDVVGVDNDPKRLEHYPFECHQGDALEFLLTHGHKFAHRHVSPPCTGCSRGTAALPDRLTRYDRLIAATREALLMVGGPYTIENVEDAKPELRSPTMLCGRMFGLKATDTDGTPLVMDRHRLVRVQRAAHGTTAPHPRRRAGRRRLWRRPPGQAGGPGGPQGRLRPEVPRRAARAARHTVDDRAGLLAVYPAGLRRAHRRAAHGPPAGERRMTRRTDPHLFRQDPRERNIACKVCGGAPAEPIHLISADCGCLGDLHDRDNCPDRSQP